MPFGAIVGIMIVLALIIGVGLLSGRKVKDSSDFLAGGGRAGALMVSGAILGSLVSSQATIGTAQLAFHYGFAAWWFTLGSGIGCLFLAVGYVRGLRRSGCVTEIQIISHEFGAAIGSLGSVLCSVGIFISVLAQVLACIGLISVLFPSLPTAAASLLSVLLMCVYVIFGGAWGAGMGGVIKLLLLSFTAVLGMLFVLVSSGGLSGLGEALRAILAGTGLGAVQQAANGLPPLQSGADVTHRFFSLIARGPMKDIGSGLSLLLGVLSTQTYAQAIWSGKSDKAARRGALLSALLIPPIGVGGICIGLFMRTHYILQAEADALAAIGAKVPDLPVLASTIQVFPTFVLDHLPALAAGIILGTLLITVVGGGAGLSLGMATILVKDILKRLSSRISTPKQELSAVRLVIAAILLAAAAVTAAVPGSTINDLGFLSMGLRGTVIFVPLTCAIFCPGRFSRRGVLLSMVLAPLTVLAGSFLHTAVDPLFIGMAVSALCCLVWPKPKESSLDRA